MGNYARIEGVPEVLAVVLAALGVAVLAQLMVVWVQRRRRAIAILKTIGFVSRQVLSLVAWQAGTFAAVSLLIGIPLGIVVGRGAWVLFGNELGIGSSSVVPGFRIALCIPAVFLIALIVEVGPRGPPAAWSLPEPCSLNNRRYGMEGRRRRPPGHRNVAFVTEHSRSIIHRTYPDELRHLGL